jgi:hypothetical protein
MRHITILVCMLVAAFAASAQTAETPSPGSTALVEDAKDWDGRAVSFKGEAIGEAMRRGTMAWIHLNDDAYGLAQEAGAGLSGFNSGIGVWVDARLASRIALFGDYKHHGDVAEVTGIFHAACPQHGGDLDIHAESLRIMRGGHEVARPIGRSRLLAAGMMVALTALLFLVRAIVRRRSGRGGPAPRGTIKGWPT